MKAHCLFEQSGTFKRAFQKFGIPAEDYDILNDFGETDNQVDLFSEIRASYEGGCSLFDKISTDDIVIAFFPCIAFENQQIINYMGNAKWMDKWDDLRKLEYNLKLQKQLGNMIELITKLAIVCYKKNIKLIIENPYSEQHFLTRYWCLKPKVIDINRRQRGDWFVKPTQYWFINLDPKENLLMSEEYICQKESKKNNKD